MNDLERLGEVCLALHPDVDWDEVAALCEDAYGVVALLDAR